MPRNDRVFDALSREGLTVTHDGHGVYTVLLSDDPNAVPAEILLPDSLPLEGKALRQLAELAAVRHPDGGHVCRACATPDFHPGDAGIAIGSVLESDSIIIPQVVGGDIACGMRFHVTDMNLDQFMSGKREFVNKLKGDYLLGTRDVCMDSESMTGLFREGLPAWLSAVKKNPLGSMGRTDLSGLEDELDRVMLRGSFSGDARWVPDSLTSAPGDKIRDEGLGTVGRGNHFVEVQIVEEVLDKALAYEWGVRKRQVAFMIHSGSRNVGRHIGGNWHDQAKGAWPTGLKYPDSKLFPISIHDPLFAQYLQAEATGANYAFANRAILAELFKLRMREVFGDFDAPLVYDLPHNVTIKEGDKWISRKGACPAHEGQPVIIPGSMGASSYLLVGKGNDRFLNSASHGAGRATARGKMHGKDVKRLGLEGVDCITLREERRIEESPASYKDISEVVKAQVDAGLVSVVARMKPILTFKA